MSSIIGIRHIGLVVSDMGKAIHFYRDLLGLKIISHRIEKGEVLNSVLKNEEVEVETVKLGVNDSHTVLELLFFHKPPLVESGRPSLFKKGLTHLALTVDDLRGTYSRLSELGIYFNAPPQRSHDNKVLITFCRDPEDNWIELVEPL